MLKYISIMNLAVVQELSLELFGGLNLLTGETGAGKSIIIDAVSLLLGGRGGAEVIRTGEKRCVVEGVFALSRKQRERIKAILSDAGVEVDEDEDLSVRRELQSSGRRRTLINDQAVPLSVMRTIQPRLIEILGQGEQHTLVSSRSHLEILDGFAGCAELKADTASAYERWRTTAVALRQLLKEKAERERLGDYLNFQIREIEKVDPKPSEDAELAAERSLLANAEKALDLCTRAYTRLYEEDGSVLSQTAIVRKGVEELQAIDPGVGELVESIKDAEVKLSDVAESLRGYGSRYGYSPERLSAVEGRLSELERLKKKYGSDLEGILRQRDDLRRKLDELETLEAKESELRESLQETEERYLDLARRLSEVRKKAAPRFEARVMDECKQLALERARFTVSFETAPTGGDAAEAFEWEGPNPSGSVGRSSWSAQGIDRVDFFFSANEGEDVRPLARAASGGELSRLMLALRTVSKGTEGAGGEKSSAVTLVFDEVDAGIGGRTAESVGRRLKSLAGEQQVLCVTHQPQIARFADHHFKVTKNFEGGRTLTGVKELSEAERVGELARMIGGSEDVEEARGAARWMLSNAEGAEGAPAEGKRRRRTVAKV